MKRIAIVPLLALSLSLQHRLAAQDAPPPQPVYHPSGFTHNHGEIGVFADLFRFAPTSDVTNNFVGVGAQCRIQCPSQHRP